MDYYALWENTHTGSSWVLRLMTKRYPKRIRPPELPSVVHTLLGRSREGEMTLKERYGGICCKSCGWCDTDVAFDRGFEEPVVIKFKGDFGVTDDRVFVVTDKFLNVLKTRQACGYESKPLGTSGWHAIRITLRINTAKGVVTEEGSRCEVCGHTEDAGGLHKYEAQLSLPKDGNTFFTSLTTWRRSSRDREIFLTGDLAIALKEGGICGGYCHRLLTNQEKAKQEEMHLEGERFWEPPKTRIFFGGKK